MKKLFGFGKKKKKESEQIDWPVVDLDAQIKTIRSVEDETEVELGKKIHQFDYHEFELRLDRDVTGTYRICANQGPERRFSFSVKTPHRDYKGLRDALELITEFLNGERRIAQLPNNDIVKGHFFAQG